MTDYDNLPDPEECVGEMFDDRMRAEEPGVYHDTLRDAISEVEHAQHVITEAYAGLDGVCDDRGLFPDEFHSRAREMQREATVLSEWLDEFKNALSAEYDDFRDSRD